MVDWLIAWTAVASLAVVLQSVVLFLVYRHNKRDSERQGAIVRAKVAGEPDGSSVTVEVWNEGMKDTQIRDFYLEWGPDNELPAKVGLRFEEEEPVFGDPQVPDKITNHQWKTRFLIGEILESGRLWRLRVRTQSGAPMRAKPNPTIYVVPVLGKRVVVPVGIPIKAAMAEGIAFYQAQRRRRFWRRVVSFGRKERSPRAVQAAPPNRFRR